MLESAKSQVGHTAWPCALQHSTLIKNVVPHSSLPVGVSPFKLWMGNKPSVSTICAFGCKAMVAVPEKQHDKLVSCKGCPSWKSHTPCVILTLSSLGGTLPPTSIQSEFARITATAISIFGRLNRASAERVVKGSMDHRRKVSAERAY